MIIDLYPSSAIIGYAIYIIVMATNQSHKDQFSRRITGHFKFIVVIKTINLYFFGFIFFIDLVTYFIGFLSIFNPGDRHPGLTILHSYNLNEIILIGTCDNRQGCHMLIIPFGNINNIISSAF